MPIPKAGAGPISGKSFFLDWTDDDASDLEVLNPTPLALIFPLIPSPAGGDKGIHEAEPVAKGGGKKRASSGPNNVPERRNASGIMNRPRPMAIG
jgi:hypothetical protein